MNNIFPKGRRVGIVTNSGGSGSILTKSAELYGLEVPEFSKQLQLKISKFIPPTASKSNPVDITFFRNYYNFFVKLPKLIIQSGEVDSVLFDGIFDFYEVFDVIEKSGFPIDEKLKGSMGSFYNAVIGPMQKLVRRKSIPLLYSGPQLYSHPLYQVLLDKDVPIF
ncbi:MAG: hypothetical protein ACXAC7_24610, partial [Candidatus Hodarchaeales archaeon]